MQPLLVGEVGGVDDKLGEGLGVVVSAELPPPPAHPTVKAGIAASPNTAIAALASDFMSAPDSVFIVSALSTHPMRQ